MSTRLVCHPEMTNCRPLGPAVPCQAVLGFPWGSAMNDARRFFVGFRVG